MNINYKKILITTAIFTISALLVVSIIIATLMYFVFTKEFANFCYSLGMDTFSSNLYLKDYEKTGDIFSCYKALNLKIKINDDEQTIEIYKKFIEDKDYAVFMKSIEYGNELMSVGIIEKSTILNEEEYLESKYIEALYDKGYIDDAFELSLDNFRALGDSTLRNQGVFTLNLFISRDMSSDVLDKFNTIYDDMETELANEMQEYFNEIFLLFNENKDVPSKLDKSYLLVLCNRIMIVGNSVNILNSLNSQNELNISNLEKMEEVNNFVKELVKG